jgi:hypothetical protein
MYLGGVGGAGGGGVGGRVGASAPPLQPPRARPTGLVASAGSRPPASPPRPPPPRRPPGPHQLSRFLSFASRSYFSIVRLSTFFGGMRGARKGCCVGRETAAAFVRCSPVRRARALDPLPPPPPPPPHDPAAPAGGPSAAAAAPVTPSPQRPPPRAHLVGHEQDLATQRALASVDVANEHHVQVVARVLGAGTGGGAEGRESAGSWRPACCAEPAPIKVAWRACCRPLNQSNAPTPSRCPPKRQGPPTSSSSFL